MVPKFKIEIPLDYMYIGGLTRVTNRFQLNEIPAEDVELEVLLYLDLPLGCVLADKQLQQVFDNTSKVYAGKSTCEALGISADYSAITKFVKENVPLFVWVYEKCDFPRLCIYARNAEEVFQTLRNLA